MSKCSSAGGKLELVELFPRFGAWRVDTAASVLAEARKGEENEKRAPGLGTALPATSETRADNAAIADRAVRADNAPIESGPEPKSVSPIKSAVVNFNLIRFDNLADDRAMLPNVSNLGVRPIKDLSEASDRGASD